MQELEALFSLAISPFGGAFMLGVLVGACAGWYVMSKHVIDAKIRDSEAICNAKIEALETQIAELRPVAEKWSQFMERRALEALGEDI